MKDQLMQFKEPFIALAEFEHILGEQQTYESFVLAVLQKPSILISRIRITVEAFTC